MTRTRSAVINGARICGLTRDLTPQAAAAISDVIDAARTQLEAHHPPTLPPAAPAEDRTAPAAEASPAARVVPPAGDAPHLFQPRCTARHPNGAACRLDPDGHLEHHTWAGWTWTDPQHCCAPRGHRYLIEPYNGGRWHLTDLGADPRHLGPIYSDHTTAQRAADQLNPPRPARTPADPRGTLFDPQEDTP